MLCVLSHTLMETRNGPVVQSNLTQADGHGERKAAMEMTNRQAQRSTRRQTLGTTKGLRQCRLRQRTERGMVLGAQTIP